MDEITQEIKECKKKKNNEKMRSALLSTFKRQIEKAEAVRKLRNTSQGGKRKNRMWCYICEGIEQMFQNRSGQLH